MYAGEMRFMQSGKLKYWNNASGHYLPDAEDAGKVIDILKNSGLDDISMDNFVPRE
ncbi:MULTISPECIES: hypothetical protein [unclassified Clostridium]|uniref:hypothetical protein n=1 Tax=unclassified Clostridium TaxID=2614128 RepID=UPI0002979F43|nr:MULTISPECIES: hypothetical protein [unclassified Clostridium]EKQ53198.1 MAG: hypothetical protein A370_03886 [Clostridium sp. Maddingley MBC34-26]